MVKIDFENKKKDCGKRRKLYLLPIMLSNQRKDREKGKNYFFSHFAFKSLKSCDKAGIMWLGLSVNDKGPFYGRENMRNSPIKLLNTVIRIL